MPGEKSPGGRGKFTHRPGGHGRGAPPPARLNGVGRMKVTGVEVVFLEEFAEIAALLLRRPRGVADVATVSPQ